MYTHKDADSDWLTIEAGTGRRSGKAIVHACYNGVEITPADLPAIVAKLREACGLPSPVILERPDVLIADGRPAFCGDLSLSRHEDGISMGLPGVVAAAVSPDAIRRRAAFMVAYADAVEAEPEPDPAEVEELATALHAAAHVPGCALGPAENHFADARVALRWMRDREARNA